MSRKRKPKRLACRFCGDTIDAAKGPEHVSHWSHTHPAVCSYRLDSMPSLNGVHVGDLWRNAHTGDVVRIAGIKLGGAGTYTDREPCVILAYVWQKERDETKLDAHIEPTLDELAAMPDLERGWRDAHPLWSLVEHWEPLTRPDSWPLPWHWSTRFEGSRSADDEWRCPGYRHPEEPEKDEREKAYWHAWHTVVGHGIQWERTNVLWQVDADAEPTLDVIVPPAPQIARVSDAPLRRDSSPAEKPVQEALF